jgi:hypothetical protein
MADDATATLVEQLTAGESWVRRRAAEALIEDRAETGAVIACLLNELRHTAEPGSLYDDRHHEIHDAAWGAQFDFLRAQWPWFVRGLMTLGVECPRELLDDPSIAVRLNACRLVPDDPRVVPILRSCLHRYHWLDDSFWTFIAAAELIAHLGERATALRPDLEAIVRDAPARSVPGVLAAAILSRP